MYRAEGFVFETEKQAQAAKKEAAGIRYIRQQVRMDDPDAVLKLYNNLIVKEVFATPVGISFLGKLREYLVANPRIKNSDIKPIPAVRMQAISAGEKDAEFEKKIAQEQRELEENRKEEIRRNRSLERERERLAQQGRNYRTRFHVSTFFAIVFAAALVGMFVITALSQDNVTIANYETEILNKYASWEMQLSEKESELKSREAAVQKREDELGITYEDTEEE